MTLRRDAPGDTKPLAILPVLAALAALTALQNQLAVAEPRANGIIVTRTEHPLNLPDAWLYDRVWVEVFGAEPATRNGKTGQITMFVLLFIFLSAVTLLAWRHPRRDYASPRRIGRRI